MSARDQDENSAMDVDVRVNPRADLPEFGIADFHRSFRASYSADPFLAARPANEPSVAAHQIRTQMEGAAAA